MSSTQDEVSAEKTLAELLHDLNELSNYLTERGRHTYELAQRFTEHARQRQDASSRAYDERQAVMLGYQHYLWIEIAGLVNKLLVTYEVYPDEPATAEDTASDQPPTGKD